MDESHAKCQNERALLVTNGDNANNDHNPFTDNFSPYNSTRIAQFLAELGIRLNEKLG